MQLIEIVERETVQQIILTKSSINFLGEAIGIGSCASGVIGQILHLLQPHNLRRFKQPISPLSKEDLRRTNREILVTGQSKHRVDAVEQTRAKELRTINNAINVCSYVDVGWIVEPSNISRLNNVVLPSCLFVVCFRLFSSAGFAYPITDSRTWADLLFLRSN